MIENISFQFNEFWTNNYDHNILILKILVYKLCVILITYNYLFMYEPTNVSLYLSAWWKW